MTSAGPFPASGGEHVPGGAPDTGHGGDLVPAMLDHFRVHVHLPDLEHVPAAAPAPRPVVYVGLIDGPQPRHAGAVLGVALVLRLRPAVGLAVEAPPVPLVRGVEERDRGHVVPARARKASPISMDTRSTTRSVYPSGIAQGWTATRASSTSPICAVTSTSSLSSGSGCRVTVSRSGSG